MMITGPGQRLHNELENHHFLNGKTPYKWSCPLAMLVITIGSGFLMKDLQHFCGEMMFLVGGAIPIYALSE